MEIDGKTIIYAIIIAIICRVLYCLYTGTDIIPKSLLKSIQTSEATPTSSASPASSTTSTLSSTATPASVGISTPTTPSVIAVQLPSTTPSISSPVPNAKPSDSSQFVNFATPPADPSTYIKLKHTWSDENKNIFSPNYACKTNGKINAGSLLEAKNFCETCGEDCYAVTMDEENNFSVRQGSIDEKGGSDRGESTWYITDKVKAKPTLPPAPPKIILKNKWSDEVVNTYSEGHACGLNGQPFKTGDLTEAKKLCEDCKDCNSVLRDNNKFYPRQGKMRNAKSSFSGESTWFNLGDPNAPPETEPPTQAPVVITLKNKWSNAMNDTYSGDIACPSTVGSKSYKDETEAKFNCENCGAECNAVTADMDGNFSLRKSKQPQSSDSGETSWFKIL